MANQFVQYIGLRGGFTNDDERTYARKLVEMTQAVDREGTKVVNDIAKDAFRELVKGIMR